MCKSMIYFYQNGWVLTRDRHKVPNIKINNYKVLKIKVSYVEAFNVAEMFST
jgi:hypothetical protein